jgi:hypothetical protein
MLNNQDYFYNGLCGWATGLYNNNKITYQERKSLEKYIADNKPSMFSSFERFICFIWVIKADSGYYWKPTHIEPRIKWINKHIKKNL